MSLWYLPSSCGSIRLTIWERMSFEEFQDGSHGGHVGQQNGTILMILNLYNAPMPPINFRVNQTYDLGGVVFGGISRWPPLGRSLISERNDCFGNSESESLWCRPFSFGSIRLTVWEMSFEEFQDGCRGGHLGYRSETILLLLWISVSLWCLPSSFGSIRITIFKEMSFEEFQDLGYRNKIILLADLYVAPIPPPPSPPHPPPPRPSQSRFGSI